MHSCEKRWQFVQRPSSDVSKPEQRICRVISHVFISRRRKRNHLPFSCDNTCKLLQFAVGAQVAVQDIPWAVVDMPHTLAAGRVVIDTVNHVAVVKAATREGPQAVVAVGEVEYAWNHSSQYEPRLMMDPMHATFSQATIGTNAFWYGKRNVLRLIRRKDGMCCARHGVEAADCSL